LGRCHALLAGVDRGILGTTDDNLVPCGAGRLIVWHPPAWPLHPYIRRIERFLRHLGWLFRSTDGGGSWQVVRWVNRPITTRLFSGARLSRLYRRQRYLATHEDRVTGRRSLYQSATRATWSVQFAHSPRISHGASDFACLPRRPDDFVAQATSCINRLTRRDVARSPHRAAWFYFSTLELEISSLSRPTYPLCFRYDGVRLSSTAAKRGARRRLRPAMAWRSRCLCSDRTVWHTFRSIEGWVTAHRQRRAALDRWRSDLAMGDGRLPGAYEPFQYRWRPLLLCRRPHALHRAQRPLTPASTRALSQPERGTLLASAGPCAGNPSPADLAVTADSLGRLAAHVATDSVSGISVRSARIVWSTRFEVDAAWSSATLARRIQ